MRAEARKAVDDILAHPKTLANHSLDEPDRLFNGMLGEMAFKELLKEEKKLFTYEHKHDGKDGADFLVAIADKNVTLDVKTCTKSFHKLMAMPERQYRENPYDIYVGVRLDLPDYAEIQGFCFYKELEYMYKDKGLKIPSYGRYLEDLKPIESLLNHIKGIGNAVYTR